MIITQTCCQWYTSLVIYLFFSTSCSSGCQVVKCAAAFNAWNKLPLKRDLADQRQLRVMGGWLASCPRWTDANGQKSSLTLPQCLTACLSLWHWWNNGRDIDVVSCCFQSSETLLAPSQETKRLSLLRCLQSACRGDAWQDFLKSELYFSLAGLDAHDIVTILLFNRRD